MLRGRDSRLLVVVGPCSVHDPSAALEYAERLLGLRRKHADQLLVVMRVYFEKPRTSVGWKGLINDPYLNGSHDIGAGLRIGRELLLRLANLGIPAATEVLDPIVRRPRRPGLMGGPSGHERPRARPIARWRAAFKMPVGYKNGTDGGLDAAIHALAAASRPHSFRAWTARVGSRLSALLAIRTGTSCFAAATRGPNYAPEHVAAAADALKRAGAEPAC